MLSKQHGIGKALLKTGTALTLATVPVLGGSALAQVAVQAPDETDADAPSPASGNEIVVTGTQIRGIQPVGSNVVGVDREDIRATGVADTNQLLAQLPQSNFFANIPEPGGGNIAQGAPRVPVNRPNLRNIPGTNTGSGSPTLVLMDGHRIVPAGIEQSVVDVGLIPTGLLERMEVILDGASATYGSDAVAGVINFIMRGRMEGTEVSGRVGFAKDYYQVDGSIAHGFAWDTGGINLSYEFAKNDNILNNERAHQAPINWLLDTPMVDDLTCATANIQNATAGSNQSIIYSGPGRVRGASYCGNNAYETYVPAQRRHSALVTVAQELGSTVDFALTAFYSNRKTNSIAAPFTGSATVLPSHVNYVSIPEFGAAANQRVLFSFGPVLGNDIAFNESTVQVGQITPSLRARLGGDWQVRALFSYGKSRTDNDQNRLDTTLLRSYFTAANGANADTTINPYNLTATPNRALIDRLVWRNDRWTEQSLYQGRVVADGPLFSLPGGDVRVAVGGEWIKTSATRVITNETTHRLNPPVSASSTSKSAFVEVIAPIVGADNRSPGLAELTLSLSGRYDSYDDGNETFNPRVAATYKPVDWITIRGNWGTSFRAPNPIDKVLSNSNQLRCIGAQAGCVGSVTNVPAGRRAGTALPANITAVGDRYVYLFLTGTSPNLQPETSTSWSIGADVSPPAVPGLTLSGTYWNIDFENFISSPNLSASPLPVLNDFPQLSPVLPDSAALDAFASGVPGGNQVLNDIVRANGYTVAYWIDSRVRNLGGAKLSGVDASIRYRQPTQFGSVDANINMSWPLQNDFQLAPGGPVTDLLRYDAVKFTMSAMVGVNFGNLRTQATFRHRSGYVPTPPAVGAPPDRALGHRDHVDGFDTLDLAFRYNLEGSDLFTRDLTLSLNINNVFDQDPPLAYTQGGGTIPDVSTLGRFFQFGVSKRF